MFLLFLAFLARSADFQKTICVRSSSIASDICKGKPTINPESSIFYEEYSNARKNSLDILFIFDEAKNIDITLDALMFAGQNVRINTSRSNKVNIILLYDSKFDYSATSLEFGNKSLDIKIQSKDSSSETFKIGNLICNEGNNLVFVRNSAALSITYINIDVGFYSLANATTITHLKTGNTMLRIRKTDSVSATLGHELKFKLGDEGTPVTLNYVDKETLCFEGISKEQDSGEKLELNIEISKTDAPGIIINKVGTLTIKGALWAPTTDSLPMMISYIKNLNVPTGDFLFDLTLPSNEITLNGPTKFCKPINVDKYYTTILKYDKTEPVNIEFKDVVSSTIEIQSPYLNLIIETFNLSIITNDKFPIEIAFNEDHISAVTINNVVGSIDKDKTTKTFNLYCTIINPLDETVISDKGFYRGISFCTMPKGSIEIIDFNTEIDYDCPASKTTPPIPGFSQNSNNFDVNGTTKESTNFVLFMVSSPYEVPYAICFSSSSYSCTKFDRYPNIDPTTNKFNPNQMNSLSELIPSQYKNIIISIYNTQGTLNFDSLVANSNSYNIMIVQYSTSYAIDFKNDNKNLKSLSILSCKLRGTLNFDMEKVELRNIISDTSLTFSVGTSTDFYVDFTSFEKMKTKLDGSITNCFVTYYETYSSYPTILVRIDSDKWGFTRSSYGKPTYTEFSTSYVTNMNYVLNDKTEILLEASAGDSVKGLNIYVNKTYPIQFDNSTWNKVTMNPKINIHHDDQVNVVLTHPYQLDHVVFTGHGSIVRTIEYDSPQSICYYVDTTSTQNNCYKSYSGYKSKIEYNEEMSESIFSLKGNNQQIDLSVKSEPIELNFSVFEFKQIQLKTYTNPTTSESPNTIVLNIDSNKIDRNYSKTIFKNLKVELLDKDVTELEFGYLTLDDTSFSADFSKVSITVTQLVCTYAHLFQFKHIKILDQLTVTGEIPAEAQPIEIEFINDEDANDLDAEISGDCSLEFGKNEFKLNNLITFKMTQSDNYDALFTLKTDAKVDMKVKDGVTKDDITRISFKTGYNKNTSFTFTGNWPRIGDNEESLFEINSQSKVLEISFGGYLPLSVPAATNMSFILLSNDNTLHGPVGIDSNSGLISQLWFETKISEQQKVNIDIINGIFFAATGFTKYQNTAAIVSPNIHLTTKNILPSEYMINDNSRIVLSFILSIGKDDTSSIEVVDMLKEPLAFAENIQIISKLFGKIEGNEKDFPFFKRSNILIKARSVDLNSEEYNFEYYEEASDLKRTHGFYKTMNCLKLDRIVSQTEAYREFVLIRDKYPSEIPFTVGITSDVSNDNSELLITPEDASGSTTIANNIPDEIGQVVITVLEDSTQVPLNFATIVGSRTSLVVDISSPSIQEDKTSATMTIPSSSALDITICNLKITFSGANANEIKANKLNFTDCAFIQGGFTVGGDIANLVLDVDSLNGLIDNKALSTYHNPLLIHSANIIIFGKDSWQFKENIAKDSAVIKAADFDKISLETHRALQFQILDNDISEIVGLKLNSYPIDDGNIYATFSRRWQNISKINGEFIVKTNDARGVKVTTSSYPIPSIFDIANDKIDYSLRPDIEGKFDEMKYNFEKTFTDENVLLDLTALNEPYHVVKAKSLRFGGKSSFLFVDKVGELDTVSLEIFNNSEVEFDSISVSKELILNYENKVDGDFSFTSATNIYYYWNFEKVPHLYLQSPISTIPNLIIVYPEESFNQTVYNEKLYRKQGFALMEGNFDCESLIRVKPSYKSPVSSFADGPENLLDITCDDSSFGKVLLLYGTKEIKDEEPDSGKQGDGGDSNLSTGGTIGVVIGCVVFACVVVGIIVFLAQRKKIKNLENMITERADAYKDAQNDTVSDASFAEGIGDDDDL